MIIRACSNCVMLETRPRISFDSEGLCSACSWAVKKDHLDWRARQSSLEELLNSIRNQSGRPDCVVPMSGGKDGTYVYHRLKEDFGMNPIGLTIRPPLPTELGEENLRAFLSRGANHVSIHPSSKGMKKLNKYGFVNLGFPYFGWLTAILTGVIGFAWSQRIPLVMYGEDGEMEYGGSQQTANSPGFSLRYLKEIYLEGGYEDAIQHAGLSRNERTFFELDAQISEANAPLLTHWSYFEAWDPYRNYLLAKERYGLQEFEGANSGTFTNFAQNDQSLYPLHTYLMFLKFGFGRATQDACIDIRRGALSRQGALELVAAFDGVYPEEFEDLYLDYFEMKREEFLAVLKRWTNPDLFDWTGGRPVKRFEVA